MRLELLGGFRLFLDGRTAVRPPGARQQQLIAFLVLHASGAAVPRQRVAGSLWPESTDVQALTNLRRELHHLREGWPKLDALIDAESRTLSWAPGARATVDVVEFAAAAERGLQADGTALPEAARLYQGELLPGCEGDWIDGERERLGQQAKAVLTRLVARLEETGDFTHAIEQAQKLLRIDPLDEQAWCALMRSHARRGDRATALHLYQQCAALLKKELGVQPSAVTRMTYREIVDQDADEPAAPPAASPHTAAYPLVGRRSEWQTMLTAWRTAAAGRMQMVAIRGESGIGKSRLAEELVSWAGVNGVIAVTTRCFPGDGRLAYAPVAAWLKSEALAPALARLDGSWLTDVARLHPGLLARRPDVAAPGRQLESWERLRFFEALAQAVRAAAPLVMVVDDLQWVDGDTVEWLQYFARSVADVRCLVVATVRAEEEQDNPALARLLAQLTRDGQLAVIALGPLDRTATAQLAGEVLGTALDESALAHTFRETEGHPLFIVERGRMALARQQGSETGTAAGTALPQVQAVVAARLALLSDDARALAEVAAAVGRDFPFDILAQASDLEEDALVRALDELWRRHIVRVQEDERWDFSHDRIRETAYEGIGPARRRLIHRRIAQAMELLYADRLEEASAAIAVHLDRGGQAPRAVPFLERAAAVAARVSANEEAIRCLMHALAIVERLPAGRDRDGRELALRESLSVALNSTRGYAAPEVEQNLDRVWTLSRGDGRGPVPVRWLWAAFTMRFMLGDLTRTRQVSEEALSYAVRDPSCRCEAHHAMGGTLMSMGELEASRTHFEASLAAYDEAHPQRSAFGSDLGVFGHAWYSHTLWLLGDDAGALSHAARSVALARRHSHVYSETLGLAYTAMLHQMRLDVPGVLAAAEPVVALCETYGFAYYGDWAQALIGWARGLDDPAHGVALMEAALERLDRYRARARRPYYLSLLADTCGRLGDRRRMSSIVESATTLASESGDVWWLPALLLQRAEVEPAPTRDAAVQRALDVARAQGSVGLERRILASAAVRSL